MMDVYIRMDKLCIVHMMAMEPVSLLFAKMELLLETCSFAPPHHQHQRQRQRQRQRQQQALLLVVRIRDFKNAQHICEYLPPKFNLMI